MEPSSTWPENLPISHRKRAIQELIQGRKLASQLQMMLRNSESSTSVSVDDLAVQITATFHDTLSILNFAQILSDDIDQVSDQVIPANLHQVGSGSNWDGGKSEDSSEGSKTSVAAKDGRGCYKRRKTSQTCEKVTSTLVDDGHAWRKYGQKQILNAKHPRNYYRCTHKFEQGCKATKQVQKTDQDDPPMYRTTYHGPHTCGIKPPAHQIIWDGSPTATATATATTSCSRDSSILLSFESKAILEKKADDDSYNFPTLMIKHDQYSDQEDINSQCMYHPHSPAPCDYLTTSSGLMTFDSSRPMPTMLSAESSDVLSSSLHSCTRSRSTHSFGMDHVMVGSPNFDDFQFEFCS